MDLALVGIGLSVLGSVVTSAIMIGSMRSDLHHLKNTLANLASQQNEHLQYHLKNRD